MAALQFTCPNTNRLAPSGINIDVAGLRKWWSKKLSVNCSLCGNVHEFSVREMYLDSVLDTYVPRIH